MSTVITSTRDGEVIEGRTGAALDIRHNNVTIRNCTIGATLGTSTIGGALPPARGDADS